MGMFDTVRAQNIVHKNFKHNGVSFQTKDLECELSDYIIFNGRLWLERDGAAEEELSCAVDTNFEGNLCIYTSVTHNDITKWIEYCLTFDHGSLVGVELMEERISSDKRDLSESRPNKPSNRMMVKIDISDLDEQEQDKALEALEGKLQKLREVLDNPCATIVYPARPTESGLFAVGSGGGKIRYVTSVVQSLSDFQDAVESGVPIKSAGGDSVTFLADEFSHYSKRDGD